MSNVNDCTVKAYVVSGTILLKYFYDQQDDTWSCPACGWLGGDVNDDSFFIDAYQEVTCPRCRTLLGQVFGTGDSLVSTSNE